MPVAIVSFAFFSVDEDFVSFGHFFEFDFGLWIADVPIRVILTGQFSVSFFNMICVRISIDAENFVVIALTGHCHLQEWFQVPGSKLKTINPYGFSTWNLEPETWNH